MSKKFSALPRLTVIAVAAILGANAAQADELEVLHWWTSGGEAKAARRAQGDMIEARATPGRTSRSPAAAATAAMTALKRA